MKRTLIILTLCLLAAPAAAQDNIARGGAKVAVNADGSVTVSMAAGKTFGLKCYPNLPVSGALGQFYCKSGSGAGVYVYDGATWVPVGGFSSSTGAGAVVLSTGPAMSTPAITRPRVVTSIDDANGRRVFSMSGQG